MLNSATRLYSPAFDPDELQKLIKPLVAADGEKLLPKSRPETFLYLRPMMIATAAASGVQKPKEALLYIIACCFPGLTRRVEQLDRAVILHNTSQKRGQGSGS